jgi:hypothetical protein
MPQVFQRGHNAIARASLVGLALLVAVLSWAVYVLYRSPYVTAADAASLQPIPFSHQHHVGVLGFDCRYCHTSVEESSFAGIPPTKTCMNCHSQFWVGGGPTLEPVRESYRTGEPLRWQRVHNLQQFAYFDHSIHVAKGVGCVTCHGRVDQMPLVRQTASLLMEWCLDCHRQPEQYLRPREEVFNMAWQPSGDQRAMGGDLVQEYHIRDARFLTSCSTCHR